MFSFFPTAPKAQEQVMSRLFKANTIRRLFANRKDRVIVSQAKTSDHVTLHAPAVHALYTLCGSLGGMLCAGRASMDACATPRQTERSTQTWQAWTSAMQPCTSVRRVSPVVVGLA